MGLAALIALLVIVLVIRQVKMNRHSNGVGRTTLNGITTSEVDFAKAPQKFPADIPIESGAKITQNYNATTADGHLQATRVFETKKSLEDNFKIYTNYLTKAGYEVKSTVDQTNYKMVYGIKDNSTIQVSIDENSQLNVKTVNISYIEVAN